MRQITINSNEAGQRFDKYLKKLLRNAQGSFVYKMLRKKNIVLNGKKADGTEKLQIGDEVKLFLAEDTFLKFTENEKVSVEYEDLRKLYPSLQAKGETLQVVYEDEDVLILNKPSGMLSQKSEITDVSINEYIISYLINKGQLTEEMLHTFRPSICNRLDRNTSGLIIAGKSLKGLQEMSLALKERTVQKYYRCIVKNKMIEDAYIKGWLVKDEETNKVTIYDKKPPANYAKEAQHIETEYHVIEAHEDYTLLEVHLITGRSHQIRAHLASIGHPIIGDYKYGDRKINEVFKRKLQIDSQLLHAYRMVFPEGREVMAECPAEFAKVLEDKTGTTIR